MQLIDEFNRLIRLVNQDNITFVRYGDGEVMLANNTPVSQGTQAYVVDKWHSHGGPTKLGEDMRHMLSHPEWYYGIPCQCCNNPLKLRILEMMPNVPADHITFANMFVNAAYPHFHQWITSLQRDVILITNEDGLGRTYPFNVKEHKTLPNDCVNWWESNSQLAIQQYQDLARRYSNSLFLFSGGPLKVLIHYMYEANPNNTYLDVGSAIDTWVHGKMTRPYHDRNSRSPYTHRNCTF